MVDGSLGKTCLINDLLERGVVIALFNEQPLRRVQNLPNGLLRIFVSSHWTLPLLNRPTVCIFKNSTAVPRCQAFFFKTSRRM